jgi:hypothetical protein
MIPQFYSLFYFGPIVFWILLGLKLHLFWVSVLLGYYERGKKTTKKNIKERESFQVATNNFDFDVYRFAFKRES